MTTANLSATSGLGFTDTIRRFPITQMPAFPIMKTEPDPDSRTLDQVSPASSISTITDSSHISSVMSQATTSMTTMPDSMRSSTSAPRAFTSSSTMFVDAEDLTTITSMSNLSGADATPTQSLESRPKHRQLLMFPLELE